MESAGKYLKRERELRGVSIEDIADSTRISVKLLVSLEDGDYENLPHRTFVKGFIQSYCKCLGIDRTDVVLRYEEHLRDIDGAAGLKPSGEDGGSEKIELPTSFVIGGLLTLGVVVIALYIFISKKDSFEARPLSSAPKVVEAPLEPPAPPAPASEIKEELEPAAVAKPIVNERKKPAHVLSLTARETTWVEVTLNESEPFEAMIREGEVIRWEGDNLSLLIGNAGGVDLSLDGEDMGSVGEIGIVVRVNIPEQ